MHLLFALALIQDWEASFASKEEAARKEAYKKLEASAGDEREAGVKALAKIQTERHQKFQADWKRLHDHFMDYGTKGEKGMMDAFGPWLIARKQACDIIFDERAYPVPPNRRASGPMQGYDSVRPRLDQAVKLFEPFKASAKESCSAAMSGGWARNLEPLKVLASLVKEGDEALKKVKESWEPLAIGSFTFLDAMARIGEEKYGEAVALYEKCTEAQKIVFFMTYCFIVENHNANKIQSGMSGSDKQCVAKLNEYRMAIGALPYEHDAKLTKAVKGHINDINSGATEYGHESKVPGKRTPSDRAQKAGWTGGVGENLAAMGGMRSVEAWFWDGGHGRNNVNPFMDKIGFADGGGYAGFNNGNGGCVLPRFAPPFAYGKWGERKMGGVSSAPSKPEPKPKNPFSQKD